MFVFRVLPLTNIYSTVRALIFFWLNLLTIFLPQCYRTFFWFILLTIKFHSAIVVGGGVLRQCIQGHSNVRFTGVTTQSFQSCFPEAWIKPSIQMRYRAFKSRVWSCTQMLDLHSLTLGSFLRIQDIFLRIQDCFLRIQNIFVRIHYSSPNRPQTTTDRAWTGQDSKRTDHNCPSCLGGLS